MKKINLVCLLLAALMILSSCAVSASTFSSDFSQNNSPEKESSGASPQPSKPSYGVSTPSSGILPSPVSSPDFSPSPSDSSVPPFASSRLDPKDIPDPVVRNFMWLSGSQGDPGYEIYTTAEDLIGQLDFYSKNHLPAAICLVRLEKLNPRGVTTWVAPDRYSMSMVLKIQKIYRSNKEFDLHGASVGDTFTAVQHDIAWNYTSLSSRFNEKVYTALPLPNSSIPLLEPGYDYIVFLSPDESEDADYAVEGYSPPLSEYSYDPLYNAKMIYMLIHYSHWSYAFPITQFFCPGFPSYEEVTNQEATKEFLNWEVEIGYETVTGKPFPQDRLDRYKEKGWI